MTRRIMPENTENNLKTTQSAAEILHRRAMLLAQHAEESADAETFFDAVVFQLAGETYALAVEFLQDVLPLHGITPVPCTPTFVAGIINVRGQIVSVLDLKALFNLPAADAPAHNVLLLSNGEMRFGIAADYVAGVQQLPKSDLQPPPSTLEGFKGEYVTGVTSQMVIVLNAEKMLNDARLIVHETV